MVYDSKLYEEIVSAIQYIREFSGAGGLPPKLAV
jgi:hypothetical protein